MPEIVTKSDLGVPSTREEAYELTLDEWISVSTAAAGSAAAWDDETVAAAGLDGGAFAIDSALGLFVVTLLTEQFPEDIINISAVPVGDWRSLGAVAAIVCDAVQEFQTRDE